MKKISIIFLSLFFLAGAGCTAQTQTANKTYPTSPSDPVYCTQDAKLCPDGSYVSRIPPNCEFAPCPSENSCPNGKCSDTNEPQTLKKPKTISIGGVVNFQIPYNCETDSGAGSTYIICSGGQSSTTSPQFVFSSDGIQVNMRRWQNYQSPYWNDVLASLKVIQPLTHAIQINIEK